MDSQPAILGSSSTLAESDEWKRNIGDHSLSEFQKKLWKIYDKYFCRPSLWAVNILSVNVLLILFTEDNGETGSLPVTVIFSLPFRNRHLLP